MNADQQCKLNDLKLNQKKLCKFVNDCIGHDNDDTIYQTCSSQAQSSIRLLQFIAEGSSISRTCNGTLETFRPFMERTYDTTLFFNFVWSV